MRILFITTLNLACNPRFYKEVMLAKKAGYAVQVICFEFHNWSYQYNQELLKQFHEGEVILIPGNRKPFVPWAKSVLGEFGFRLLGKWLQLENRALSQAVTRRSNLLLEKVESLEGPFDLVVGHNPGALFPAWYAAQIFGCKVGFDVEDYHPGEGTNRHQQGLTRQLLNTWLPHMDYVSFAAPLIKERHIQDIGKEGQEWHVFLNLFPKDNFIYTEPPVEGLLQLVWFSQNVNYQRGLEQLIPVLQEFENQVHLTLIGNQREPFCSEYVKGKSFITSLPFKEQRELNRLICSFDVGLAIEPGKDVNNQLALSNKLFTFLQAGLFILSSDTPAQRQFLHTFSLHGVSIAWQQEQIRLALENLLVQKDLIRKEKKKRFDLARTMSWESEARKLKQVWNRVVKEQNRLTL